MSKDTYDLPAQVALAVSTGRTEFIDNLISQVPRDGGLNMRLQQEVLRMCRDLIIDRHKQQTQFNDMKKLVRYLRDFSNGISKQAEILRSLVRQAEDPSRDHIESGEGEDDDAEV